MTGPEDVLEAFRRQWASTGSTLPTLAGEVLHWVRASETYNGEAIAFPYSTITITDGEIQFSSISTDPGRGDVLLMFEVEIKVWTNAADAANTSAKAIRTELDRVFFRGRCRDLPFNLSKTSATCVDLRPIAGGGLDLDEGRSEGKDVVVVRRKWEVTVQGQA